MILKKLNSSNKKYSTIAKYQALKAFQTFKRTMSMSIKAFLKEFYKRLFRTKSYGSVMPDDFLAYTLLKSSNLSNYHEELIKAAITGLQYSQIKDQLRKTFSDASR